MPSLLGHFSLVSRYYDRLFPFLNAERLRELLQLPAAGRVLDLGGGTGQVAQALPRRTCVVSTAPRRPIR